MRYFLDRTTLFLRGSFTAAATGPCGGSGRVSTIFCSLRSPDTGTCNPERERETILARAGYSCDAFGLTSTAEPGALCVLQYDYITAFVLTGFPAGTGGLPKEPAVSLILWSSEGLGEGALLEAIAVAAETTAAVLSAAGSDHSGMAHLSIF